MRKFLQIIDELELKDTPLNGGQYTWKGGLNNRRMARLDRFLITDDWETLFGGANQSLLPRPLSDHHPILLEGGRCTVKGPSPFRFENMWLKEEGLKTLVEEWWRSYEVRGTGSFVLTKKLKALKTRLKIWSKTYFGNLEVEKKEALKKVKVWDMLEERNPLTLRERELKVEVVNDFKRWALLEEVHWRHKSREI